MTTQKLIISENQDEFSRLVNIELDFGAKVVIGTLVISNSTCSSANYSDSTGQTSVNINNSYAVVIQHN